jgi:hypothetical protein
MKTQTARTLVTVACLAGLAAVAAPLARAEIDLSFSGGDGTPLSVTVVTPLVYVITGPTDPDAPYFIFKGVGNFLDDSFPSVASSTITYSVDGGPTMSVDIENVGATAGSVSADDFYLFPSVLPGVSTGDTVILYPGTITTADAVAALAPANGLYQSFINPLSATLMAMP